MTNWELRCSRDLALRLGAITPMTVAHHRELRETGHLLLRDPRTGWALFWPRVPEETARSSA